MQVVVLEKISRFLSKQIKKDTKNIQEVVLFLQQLGSVKNPQALKNAAKVQGIAGNFWRWKVAKYRIIGEIINSEAKIIIIKIDKRKEDTYDKGL